MPARATIITGQYVATHGVWMNGVSLPEETPTIAHWLQQHGYRTGLFGKAHFEPWLGDPATYYENRMARADETGPHRGFDRMEALADLEEARRAGRISEAEYQRRRAELVQPARN